MSELGALGSYMLASQTAQVSMVKASFEAQAQMVDMLLESTEELKVLASQTHGQFVDFSI